LTLPPSTPKLGNSVTTEYAYVHIRQTVEEYLSLDNWTNGQKFFQSQILVFNCIWSNYAFPSQNSWSV